MKHYYIHDDPDKLGEYEIYVVETGSETEQWLLDMLEVKRITRKEAIDMGLKHPERTWLEGHHSGHFVRANVPEHGSTEEDVVAEAVVGTKEAVERVAEERKKEQIQMEFEYWRKMNEECNPT